MPLIKKTGFFFNGGLKGFNIKDGNGVPELVRWKWGFSR
jgi:hypothetical protein